MNSLSVLVIDDDVVTRTMLRHLLVNAGYTVDEAANGREGLGKLAEGRYSVVISDWNMPEMDGVEVCREIRGRDDRGYTYTILLTSNNSYEDRVIGMRAGADDFVCKPFNEQELLQRVAAGERVLRLETKEAIIFALAKLAESRDTETGHHLERVQRYAKLLSLELSNGKKYRDIANLEFAEAVFQTSPLHDIGKVGIPDSVLLHPGKLSSEQFRIMKTHTTIGAECLQGAIQRSPSASYLRMAHDIALCHHEKFDGKGYPLGIKGESIPLAARVVAVADVYDALRSKRIYKPAFPHEKAVKIIRQDSGTHFDPELVDAFLRIHDQFDAIAERFSPEVQATDRQATAKPKDSVPVSTPPPTVPLGESGRLQSVGPTVQGMNS